MRARTAALALVTGVATLVVVGVVVTELAAPWIEFFLFVGIPIGLVAGVAAAALVVARLEDQSPDRRLPALAVAGFGVGFVVAAVVGVGAFGLRNSEAIPAAVVVGVIAASLSALWPRIGQRDT